MDRDVQLARIAALTERFSGLGQLTLRRSWTGLYDQNRLDGNMIIGNWPGQVDNFYVACGFSGHGFMHALGVERGLTELIVHGEYQTLDLSRMGYQRVVDNDPTARRACGEWPHTAAVTAPTRTRPRRSRVRRRPGAARCTAGRRSRCGSGAARRTASLGSVR